MSEKTKYIFSINTGRSGSHYLGTVFEHVEGCQAFHEPDPIGNGEVMNQFAAENKEPMRRLAAVKAKKIKQIQENCEHYMETNHCFIKGFGWYLPEHLGEENMGVVILRRDPDEIADSYLRKHTSPLRQQGREWILSPDKKNPLVKPPVLFINPAISIRVGRLLKNIIRLFRRDRGKAVFPQWIINYELACLKWYVAETEAMTKVFREKFPNIRYYETQIGDLNDYDSMKAMLDYFGCTPKPSMKDVVGKATNQKIPRQRA